MCIVLMCVEKGMYVCMYVCTCVQMVFVMHNVCVCVCACDMCKVHVCLTCDVYDVWVYEHCMNVVYA